MCEGYAAAAFFSAAAVSSSARAILSNISSIWLSVMIAINLQTSFMTPPFGFSLFYLRGAAPPEVRTIDIYRGVIPFVALNLFAILLIYFVPEVGTTLPRLFFG